MLFIVFVFIKMYIQVVFVSLSISFKNKRTTPVLVKIKSSANQQVSSEFTQIQEILEIRHSG